MSDIKQLCRNIDNKPSPVSEFECLSMELELVKKSTPRLNGLYSSLERIPGGRSKSDQVMYEIIPKILRRRR
uniref:Uncharacterized protein n=1 Tax=viral metagenome TaxID=1070528 RepID=A0A6C0EJF1_9ZZZZ